MRLLPAVLTLTLVTTLCAVSTFLQFVNYSLILNRVNQRETRYIFLTRWILSQLKQNRYPAIVFAPFNNQLPAELYNQFDCIWKLQIFSRYSELLLVTLLAKLTFTGTIQLYRPRENNLELIMYPVSLPTVAITKYMAKLSKC